MYLGGNEQSTHEYVSKLLGKETIDLNTYGRTRGRNGSYSTNWQLSARDLMTPDEVRRLDNRYALLFIRGELPVMDEKYDLMKHPNVRYTTEGGAEPYLSDRARRPMPPVEPDANTVVWTVDDPPPGADAANAVIYTNEELEQFFDTYYKQKAKRST